MNYDLFGVNSYNVIEDNENYYFFRALEDIDLNNNLTLNTYCEDYNSRKDDISRYTDSKNISLEEIWDHIREHFYPGTNCISFSTNTNVSCYYGKDNHRYVMLTVPKNNSNNIYVAAKYMIEEVDKKLNEVIKTLDKNSDLYILIKQIEDTKDFDYIKRIIDTLPDKAYSYRLVKHQYFNDEQELEYAKLMGKLSLLESNKKIGSILPRTKDNKSLIATIGMALSSSEIIHYGKIENNLTEVKEEVIYLLSIIQQVENDSNKDKVKVLKNKVLDIIKSNKYDIFTNTNITKESNLKVSDIYNLVDGKIPFYKAYQATNFIERMINSKIETNRLCGLLKEIVNNSEYDSLIDEINKKCYVIDTDFISRINNRGLKLCESVNIDINGSKDKLFTYKEQDNLLELINSLNLEEKKEFINNKVLENKIYSLLNNSREESININRYYAETIVDFINIDKVYKDNYFNRKLSSEEKELLINKLEEANCVNMFDSLKELNLTNEEITNIIINLLINREYSNIDFITLSNSSNFTDIIKSNIDDLKSDIEAIRLDLLLDIKDNYNIIPNTSINLRDYQEIAVKNVDNIFEVKNFAGVVLPTGAGKSFVAIAEMLKYKNENILYYAPNVEILKQLKKHIIKYVLGLEILNEEDEKYYKNNIEKLPEGYIFSNDIDTVIKEVFPYLHMYCYQGLTYKEDEFFESKDASLIIFDEVHRTGAKEWEIKVRKLIDSNPKAKILGITATPVRDVDNINMLDKLAEYSNTYTKKEIKEKKHLAMEMTLVDAMQDGIVVTPNIVTFDYSLENSEQYKEVKKLYESETNENKKQKYKKIYDEMRSIIEKSKDKGMSNIIKDGFINNNKPLNGRYIVFLPLNNDTINQTTEEFILNEINQVKEYFKNIDENPEIEYLYSGRKDKELNEHAINRFESSKSDHLKLIFAINMLNEGVHVEGIDGVVMLRPLGEGTKILYYQQIGRCIYALDPNHTLEPSEFPMIFDVYNNYLEQNMDRQINKHTISSDLQRLKNIYEWINKHFRYPDINSKNIKEARKAINLKRIKIKYEKYLDNNFNNLTEQEIYEITEILRIGKLIDLWNIDLGVRTIEPNEKEIEFVDTFKIKGEQQRFIELFKEATELSSNKKLSKKLRLTTILNTLDILQENNIDIENFIDYNMTYEDLLEYIPKGIKSLIEEELNLSDDYPIGEEYEICKREFANANKIFLDYEIDNLRKMGVFAPYYRYDPSIYNNKENIVDDKGFIIRGLKEFKFFNIYTGTKYDKDGYNYQGYDELLFARGSNINKYQFDRNGYYYEKVNGKLVKTDRKVDNNGFDISGNYCELNDNNEYEVVGILNRNYFDRDGYFYKYNEITKEYVKTDSKINEKGFDINNNYHALATKNGTNTIEVEYNDGTKKDFSKELSYKQIEKKYLVNTHRPYDLSFFDIEGYYYELDSNNNRVKSNSKLNEFFFDSDGFYYELDSNNNRVKTDRKYNDEGFNKDRYYVLGDEISKVDKDGFDINGLKIIEQFVYTSSVKHKDSIAFDRCGYYYEYIDGRFTKVIPETKYSKYGFDYKEYYHKKDENGNYIEDSYEIYNEHGFDIKCLYQGKSEFTEYGFDIDNYFHPKKIDSRGKETNEREPFSTLLKDEYGFDADKLFDITTKSGVVKKRPFNNRGLSRDGYLYIKTVVDEKVVWKKSKRRIDARGFDLNGVHYDINQKGEYVNPKLGDDYGFDVFGNFIIGPWIEDINGIKRNTTKEHQKNYKTRIYNADKFNYQGYYCIVEDDKVTITDSKLDPHGFDIKRTYHELLPDGTRNPISTDSKYNDRGFDINGFHYVKNNKGVYIEDTTGKTDEYGFDIDGNYEFVNRYFKGAFYEDGKNDEYGFDCYGYYTNEHGEKSLYDKYGFDRYGDYHFLLADGTRDPESTGRTVNERGFDRRGINKETESIIDINGFDIDGYAYIGDEKVPYNVNHFDVNGYFYVEENGKMVKTDRKYNDKFFDIDGYFWKEINGIMTKTNQKYNDEGIDTNDFDVETKLNTITHLRYNEKYFTIAGYNLITRKFTSIRGERINGVVIEETKSNILKNEDEKDIISKAKLILSVPYYERENVYSILEKRSKNRAFLDDYLLEYILTALILDSSLKDNVKAYIKTMNVELEKMQEELKEEKDKYELDFKKINSLTKEVQTTKSKMMRIDIDNL